MCTSFPAKSVKAEGRTGRGFSGSLIRERRNDEKWELSALLSKRCYAD
jgi:hypothetical protein